MESHGFPMVSRWYDAERSIFHIIKNIYVSLLEG